MSVANTLAVDSAVHLVTDGGTVDLSTGKLLSIADKVVELPDQNAVFTVLGNAGIAAALEIDAHHYGADSYDALVDGVRQRLPETIAAVRDQVLGAPAHWGEFAAVFAGWDGTGRADVLYVIDKPGRPFESHRIPAPNWQAIPCGLALDAGDIEVSAIELVDAQRATVSPGDPVVASGFVQLTTVDATGIGKRILKRYPDRVGERVQRKDHAID